MKYCMVKSQIPQLGDFFSRQTINQMDTDISLFLLCEITVLCLELQGNTLEV